MSKKHIEECIRDSLETYFFVACVLVGFFTLAGALGYGLWWLVTHIRFA